MKITTKISSLVLIVVGLFFFASCGGPDVSELNDALDELEESLEDIDIEDELNDAMEEVSSEVFTDEDGFFSIKFPGEPTVESQNVPTEVGDIEMVTFMYEKSATEVYMVAYSDYPSALIEMSDPKELLQGAKDGALGTYGATVTEEKEIELNENPGMMFKANSDSYYVSYEIYLVDNRLYQIVILKDGAYPSEDDYNTFIKSFTLL